MVSAPYAHFLAPTAYWTAYLTPAQDNNASNAQVLLSMAEVTYRQNKYPESQRFYDAFREQGVRPSAASLWLGIRLAQIFDDRDAYASNVLALKNLYPKSEEYLLYKASLNSVGQ